MSESILWLERLSPDAPECGAARWSASGSRASVFLHGNGVAWARRANLEADLLICSASWTRRFGEQTPDSGTLASLMIFWARALDAERLIGRGSDARLVTGRGDCPWLLRYKGDESALARREALELVMAGASLDLDVTVVLEPAAWQRFGDEDWQAWQQLVDHQLARLACLAEPEDSIPADVEQWSTRLLGERLSTHRSLGF